MRCLLNRGKQKRKQTKCRGYFSLLKNVPSWATVAKSLYSWTDTPWKCLMLTCWWICPSCVSEKKNVDFWSSLLCVVINCLLNGRVTKCISVFWLFSVGLIFQCWRFSLHFTSCLSSEFNFLTLTQATKNPQSHVSVSSQVSHEKTSITNNSFLYVCFFLFFGAACKVLNE